MQRKSSKAKRSVYTTDLFSFSPKPTIFAPQKHSHMTNETHNLEFTNGLNRY